MFYSKWTKEKFTTELVDQSSADPLICYIWYVSLGENFKKFICFCCILDFIIPIKVSLERLVFQGEGVCSEICQFSSFKRHSIRSQKLKKCWTIFKLFFWICCFMVSYDMGHAVWHIPWPMVHIIWPIWYGLNKGSLLSNKLLWTNLYWPVCLWTIQYTHTYSSIRVFCFLYLPIENLLLMYNRFTQVRVVETKIYSCATFIS